jgi:DNA-binding response OmpR family regulator
MLSGGSGGGYRAAPRILIVDDDPNLLVLLADQLRNDGYETITARDGDEALRRLRSSWPDLLIIDMMMPRMDGLSLAREIKGQADLPIIVLSAIDAGDSKADLLEEVAEDYVTKPYHYPELRARINRVLRRLGDKVPRQRLALGPNLTLELHRREATVGGRPVQLTPTESRLLYALAANLGKTVTTETLLARGWAETEDADPSYVWVTMRRLRQKVEVDPNHPIHVLTVRGVGYRLVAADDDRSSTDGNESPPSDRAFEPAFEPTEPIGREP